LDDLCNTRHTLAIGVSEQLHDGRVHPYFARPRRHCAGGRPLSEAMTFSKGGLVYILTLQSENCSSKDRRKEMQKIILLTVLIVFGKQERLMKPKQ
jgi:hypothetical protein